MRAHYSAHLGSTLTSFLVLSDFGLRFADAKETSHARTRLPALDTNVVEVNEQDFDRFAAELASETY